MKVTRVTIFLYRWMESDILCMNYMKLIVKYIFFFQQTPPYSSYLWFRKIHFHLAHVLYGAEGCLR